MLGLPRRYGARNPFGFMDLQDVQELANFFERRVSVYQVGVEGEVTFDASFQSRETLHSGFSFEIRSETIRACPVP